MRRREFLAGCGAMLAARAGKPLRGIFPIAQTPFTESDELDVEALVEQLRFVHRGGVHGFVWPQLASEWSTLTEAERLEGAEALLSAGRKLAPAIVIGVQGESLEQAVRYARHAEKMGADAIISLPPAKAAPAAHAAYYEEIGRAASLPLFVQAVGDMSVASILAMYRRTPTLRYVKDEAGQPLFRIGPLREGSGGELKIFTGGHGRTLIDEMIRGSSGSMPAASFADLYAAAWDLWQEGKRREAVEMFGRASILINEIGAYGTESLKYILHLRGVFRTWRTREKTRASLDETGKRVLRELLGLLKPWLRA
ncbi:MAG: dihydrodipicolinate synthase family protein [Bryobacteraceae bacterium]